VKDSWKNDLFQACFASPSQTMGGSLATTRNNNDTAKHNFSGHNVHLLAHINTRVFANVHFVCFTFPHACFWFTFSHLPSLFIIQIAAVS